ncbi:MFS transporter [Oenococcus sp. UCMA 17063]|nr:MFS transporter [Oenococcus sp. UCMA 17063]
MQSVVKKKSFNYGWIMISVLTFGSIIAYLDRVSLSYSSTNISTDFKLSAVQLGYILGAFQLPYAFANLPAGWLVDKFGTKKIFFIGSLLWGIITIGAGCTVGFKSLYFMRVLLGIAEAPFYICGMRLAMDWFDSKKRGLAISIFNGGNQVSSVIGGPIMSLMLVSIGWRGAFISLGILGLLVPILWLKFFKENESVSSKKKPIKQVVAKENKIKILKLFKQRSTWGMMLGDFCVTYTVWMLLTWLPNYLKTARGLSTIDVGWVTVLPYLGGVIAVPLGGYISDLLIKKTKLTPISSRKIPIIGGTIIAAVVLSPIAIIKSLPIAVALLTLGYAMTELAPGVVWTLVTDVSPKEIAGTLGAVQNFAAFVGGACAPVVTGYILAATGNDFKWAFYIAGISCLLAAISYGVILKNPIKLEDLQ